jgi:hypothetical protein
MQDFIMKDGYPHRMEKGGDGIYMPIVNMAPSETQLDPVNKLRVSMPQALIDTDFEYGSQPTKWETISLLNNRPFAYWNNQSPVANVTNVSATQNSRAIVVATTTPPAAGSVVFMQDSNFNDANGIFIVDSVAAGTSFTYTAKSAYLETTGSIFNSGVTTVYAGAVFTGAAIGGTPTITNVGTTVTVTTTIPHGLSIGNEVAITGTTATTNPPNGSWIVARVLSGVQFVVIPTLAPTGAIAGGIVYTRPQGTFVHRAFDGGVRFSSNSFGNYSQEIRQTRRYFRYQSGKGIQVSTGTLLKPSLQIDAITSSSTTVTVTCKEPHNLHPITTITVTGANEVAYNGTFSVSSVIDANKFTYTAASVPSAATASGLYNISVTGWYGAASRCGLFDGQNGLFFEFDGQVLYAVRRSSTYQIGGFIQATNGSGTISGVTVNGVTTRFSKDLTPGDFIVIKGSTYRVLSITSDTSMSISPAYRGATISGTSRAQITKTIDTRIPQSSWNLDKCDGTGVSKYNLDISKMQMFYIDFSWYGAGFVRWGVRGTDGNVIYCHKLQNNNVNYEAYMRSGNLPARYETETDPPLTLLTSSITNVATTIPVADTSLFPSSGTLRINSVGTNEIVNYTGKTATSFTGVTREQVGGVLASVTLTVGSTIGTVNPTAGVQIGQRVVGTGIPDNTYIVSFVNNSSITLSKAATVGGAQTLVTYAMGGTGTGQAFTYSATSPISVELYAPTYAPTISHWGTSVIMDGRYDDDKSFLFTRGTTTALSVAAGANNALISIRIAPSVDNGIIGNFGVREIINRMQLVMRQIGVYANGNFLVTFVLNGVTSAATTWTNVGGSSFAQTASHAAATTITGGEVIGGFYVDSTGAAFGTSTYSTDLVRDLGNSILGGGGTATNTQIYPDGPDTLTIMIQNLGGAAATAYGRISWTEAQA